MNIVMLIHGDTFGGVHNQAAQLQRHVCVAHPSTRLTAVLPETSKTMAGLKLEQLGVRVQYLPLVRPRRAMGISAWLSFPLKYCRQTFAIRNLIRELNADVLQVHGLQHVDGPIAARLAGVALCWQIVDTRAPKPLRMLLTPLVRAMSDVIMTTGYGTAKVYPGLAESRKLVAFAPASGLDSSDTSLDGVRTILGVPDNGFLIGCLANFNPQKGHLRVQEAYAKANLTNSWLRIRGGLTPGHENYARNLGWSEGEDSEVASLGRLTTRQFLQACDVVLLLAEPNSEGMPTVLIEAASLGKPTVATDVGATAEVVLDGKTGFVVDARNPVEQARVALTLLADADYRIALGNAASELYQENFTDAAFVRQHLAAYEKAIYKRLRLPSSLER